MKNVFLLLCFFLSIGLMAQSSSQSLSVIETDNTYVLSIKLDRDRSKELTSAYLKLLSLAEEPAGDAKIVGTIEMKTNLGTVILFNTKRASLKVISAENSSASREEAKRYTAFLKQELNAGPAPTPPTPPKVN